MQSRDGWVPVCRLVPEHFYYPKRKSRAHQQSLPIPLPQPLTATNILSVSVDLTVLDISYQWNHTLCGLLCVASFIQHNVFEVHPRRSVCQSITPFLKNWFIYFNWRLITLQYCSGFCHAFTWISHVYMCPPSWTPFPPPSLSHPPGSSQCTSPEHPVSCIKPWLVVCFTYDNMHVSMLVSQIIPPSPSPTESKSLFFTSVSFAVSHIGLSFPSF